MHEPVYGVRASTSRLPDLGIMGAAQRGDSGEPCRQNRASGKSAGVEISQGHGSLLRLGWLVQNIDEDVLSKAKALELFQICPRADLLTEKDVRLAHSVVPEVTAWGINGRREDVLALVHKTINAGCDGTTVDWPEWISH
jgi:hypothetical protein